MAKCLGNSLIQHGGMAWSAADVHSAACMQSRWHELPTPLVPAWAGTWGCTGYYVGSTQLCCTLGLSGFGLGLYACKVGSVSSLCLLYQRGLVLGVVPGTTWVVLSCAVP
eukprot:3547568-Rhodomonas_salina.1